MIILRSQVYGDLERDYACQRKHEVRTACCVCGCHTAVGELLTCEKELKNAVGICTVAVKMDDLSDTEKVVTCLP